MDKPPRLAYEPSPRADQLRIEPEDFFSLLEGYEDSRIILRANEGTVCRRTQFGMFVRQRSGGMVDLVSGVFVEPDRVEAIYRVREGERETFEVQIRDMGIPLSIVSGKCFLAGVRMNRFPSIPVARSVSLDSLRSAGAGTWLDEILPFQPKQELKLGFSKSPFGGGLYDLRVVSPSLGMTAQIEVTYSDRDGSCFRLWDANSETVVYKRPLISSELEVELLAC